MNAQKTNAEVRPSAFGVSEDQPRARALKKVDAHGCEVNSSRAFSPFFSRLKPSRRAALAVMLLHADYEAGSVTISESTIAEAIGLHVRGVRNIVRDIVHELRLSVRTPKGGTSTYSGAALRLPSDVQWTPATAREAWERDGLLVNERLTLASILLFGGAKSTGAWPAIATMMQGTGLSKTAVRLALRGLERKGLTNDRKWRGDLLPEVNGVQHRVRQGACIRRWAPRHDVPRTPAPRAPHPGTTCPAPPAPRAHELKILNVRVNQGGELPRLLTDDIELVLERIRARYHPAEPSDRYASDPSRRDSVARALAVGHTVDELVRVAENAELLTHERSRKHFLAYPSPVKFFRDEESIGQLLALNPLVSARNVRREEPDAAPVEVRRAELSETRVRLASFVARFGAPPTFG